MTETNYAEKFLRERFPDRADGIHRIYNGLDLASFVTTASSAAPPLIVAVGRLIVKKGFDDLVRACRLLMERGKSFRCAIIGEGPLEKALGEQLNQLGLQDCVELRGAKPQHEIREYLVAASVFVLPSVVDPDGGMDNLPAVSLEAMA